MPSAESSTADSPAPFLPADLTDFGQTLEALSAAEVLPGIQAVVHLAAIPSPVHATPDTVFRANVTSTHTVFAAAARLGLERVVWASSETTLGLPFDRPPDYAPVDEQHELRPVSLYAETKVGVEQTLLGSAAASMAATVLRLSTLYGLSPRMRFDLTVNEFVKELVVQRKLVVFGEQFWRPYVHVRDAARAFQTVLEAPADRVAGQVFNVGDTSENYRKADLLELMSERIPDADVQRAPRPRKT